MAQSFRNLILDQVGSTNREAFALAEGGEVGPLWIMARRQTAGRGRGDRHWVSEPGNLHASLLVTLSCPPAATPQLSLVAGVATIDAIRQVGNGGPAGLRLKWPNDVLIDGAKCGGILVETSGASGTRPGPPAPFSYVGDSPLPPDQVRGRLGPSPTRGEGTLWAAPRPNPITAVVGIGIDLASHPADLGRAATDLAEHGCRIAPEAMLAGLAEAVQQWLATWDCGHGFARVRESWLARAGPVGEMCTVDTGHERIAGTFADLDAEGALVISDRRGQRRTVTFGDVTLDAAAPQDGN